MKKYLLFLITLGLSLGIFGKIKIEKLEFMDLPVEATYEGEICNMVRYRDSSGDNIILTSETGPFPSKSKKVSDGRDAVLYAYRYEKKGLKYKQVWKLTDEVRDSDLSIQAEFIRKTFQVTDLDNDNIAEIWLMYALQNRGDVAGDTMKIIMYEGNKKYALRGRSRVRAGENEFDGGEYKMDNVFLAGPDVFRKFAKKLWEENIEGLRLNRE